MSYLLFDSPKEKGLSFNLKWSIHRLLLNYQPKWGPGVSFSLPIDKKIIRLEGNKFLFSPLSLWSLYGSWKRDLFGFRYTWCLRLKLLGVQFTIKRSKKYYNFLIGYNYLVRLRRPRKRQMIYKFFHHKREVTLKSRDYRYVLKLGYFLRKLHCLEPYKVKGLIYKHENRDTIPLKPGKRQQR